MTTAATPDAPINGHAIDGLHVYAGTSDEDHLLLHWYNTLHEANELALFREQAIGQWLRQWVPQRALTYAIDDDGIWFAAWLEPVINAAALSLWVRKQYRPTKAALRTVNTVLAAATEQFPVVLFATTQAAVAAQLQSFGAVRLGTIPQLFAPVDGVVLYLTSAALRGSVAYQAPLQESHG